MVIKSVMVIKKVVIKSVMDCISNFRENTPRPAPNENEEKKSRSKYIPVKDLQVQHHQKSIRNS